MKIIYYIIKEGEYPMRNQNLEYFLTIAEEGSLTKAASKLYVSQPSLSQYLKRLEKGLGVELFDHTASPLKLTYAGQRYFEYLTQCKRNDENILKELHDIREEKSGRIRLGVAMWRGACLLPEVYPEFHRRYPNIRLELSEGRTALFQKELLNDQLDLAIANIGSNMNYDQFTTELIRNEQILFAVPTQNSYVQTLLRKPIGYKNGLPVAPISIVHDLPLIMTKPGQNITSQLQSFFSANQLSPNVLLETSNLTTAINLVAAGMGGVFVPEEGSHICRREGRVTYFCIDAPKLSWELAFIYRKNAYLSGISRLFINFVKEMLG